MDELSPFLVGGTAFSGTTLLSLLLNRPGFVCLDEPDFQKLSQAHRGLPLLRRMFPETDFPADPDRDLTHVEAFELVLGCSEVLHPTILGFKTCNWDFVSFARLFCAAGLPVVLIVRDIRDTLASPLPPWLSESSLNHAYRHVWANRELACAVVRYEDLVAAPEATMSKVTDALGQPGIDRLSWEADEVPRVMMKNHRHDLLRSKSISTTRIGLWKRSSRPQSALTLETARIMGYDPTWELDDAGG
jgi:hypothetical protein